MSKYKYEPKPKGGQERRRRSFVVAVDTADKFTQVARLSGVLSSDLLQQVMQQTVDAWEQEHGPLTVGTSAQPNVKLSDAIKGAKDAPRLKRGPKGPHKATTEKAIADRLGDIAVSQVLDPRNRTIANTFETSKEAALAELNCAMLPPSVVLHICKRINDAMIMTDYSESNEEIIDLWQQNNLSEQERVQVTDADCNRWDKTRLQERKKRTK